MLEKIRTFLTPDAGGTSPTKLNLGCGSNHLSKDEGWTNVDKYRPADIVCDLEKHSFYDEGNGSFVKKYHPWPWPDNKIQEVAFNHSLEHMGETTDGFLHIVKELYRVCAPGAKITIHVPHPRHDDFINDPTHVRIITPTLLELFSKEKNEYWRANNFANTTLALHLGVNFAIEACMFIVDPDYEKFKGNIEEEARRKNNVSKEIRLIVRCVK